MVQSNIVMSRTIIWTALALACLAWACASADNHGWDGGDAPDSVDPDAFDADADTGDSADPDAACWSMTRPIPIRETR
jgi:hypothetical protein